MASEEFWYTCEYFQGETYKRVTRYYTEADAIRAALELTEAGPAYRVHVCKYVKTDGDTYPVYHNLGAYSRRAGGSEVAYQTRLANDIAQSGLDTNPADDEQP